jgi:hypothetical protein
VDDNHLRAWWAHRQGLDGSLANASAATVLERAGWQRSLGGASPYLSLFARSGRDRQDVDAAIAALDVHELPSARSCMYLVPAAHFALALRLGQGSGEEPEVVMAKKHFALTDAELDRLCDGVLAALDAGQTLEPRALKDALRGAVRDLGPEGQKRGLTSTLPLALGRLESRGQIRRVLSQNRLDQKRYSYTLWRDNPLAHMDLSLEAAHTELARLYFRWTGPARLAHFQWFSGLSAKAARAAVAPLDLVPLAPDDDRLLLPDDRDALAAFQPPAGPQVALAGSFDNIAHLRRDVTSLLAAPEHERILYGERGGQRTGGLTDLQSNPILDRGRLIGLWEYDLDTQAIVWATFDAPSAALAADLSAAVARTEAFVRDQLGDCRANSLDRPEARRPRIAALRAGLSCASVVPVS